MDYEEAIERVRRVFDDAEVVMTKRPCKLCEEAIIFVKGPKGNTMVFNAKPKTAWYIDEQKGEARSFKSYVPHWATCPNADQFRKGTADG